MKNNSLMAQPKFTDMLSNSRESIRVATLAKSSVDIITEIIKVVSATNDPVLMNSIFDAISELENTLYNTLYNYEHRQEIETPADMDTDMADY